MTKGGSLGHPSPISGSGWGTRGNRTSLAAVALTQLSTKCPAHGPAAEQLSKPAQKRLPAHWPRRALCSVWARRGSRLPCHSPRPTPAPSNSAQLSQAPSHLCSPPAQTTAVCPSLHPCPCQLSHKVLLTMSRTATGPGCPHCPKPRPQLPGKTSHDSGFNKTED